VFQLGACFFFRQKTAEGDYVCIYVSAEGEPEASKQRKKTRPFLPGIVQACYVSFTCLMIRTYMRICILHVQIEILVAFHILYLIRYVSDTMIRFTCCIEAVEAAKDGDVKVQFELRSAELRISKDSKAGVMKLVAMVEQNSRWMEEFS